MAFNDCIHMIEEKNDYGQNICPYSPATSFACPYGSVKSASAYCLKYSNKTLTGQQSYYPEGGMGGHYSAAGAVTIEYYSDPDIEKVPSSLDYLKKAHYYLGKAIESMEKENNNE